MVESNEQRLKKTILRHLICSVGFDKSTCGLVIKTRPSISPELINSFIDLGERLGFDRLRVENIVNDLIIYLPIESNHEAIYSLLSDNDPEGTSYFFELSENGDLATLELMKISNGRFIVLKSSDRGLLSGDFINVSNTIFRQKSVIRAIVESDSSVLNHVYTSLPISAIRRIIPSLVHQVLSAPDYQFAITNSDNESENNTKSEIIDITTPVMGMLLGRYSTKAKAYMVVDSNNINHAETTNNLSLESTPVFGQWKTKK